MTNFIDRMLVDHFYDQPTEEILINANRSLIKIDSKKTVLSAPLDCPLRLQEELQDFAFEQDKRLDPFHPSAGGIYNDNFRWQIVISPATFEGPIVSIRRHKFETLGFSDFDCDQNTVNRIEQIIKNNQHLVICGATASGKTSFLQCVLKYFFYDKRVAILEELTEISLQSKHWFRVNSRPCSIEGHEKIDLSFLLQEVLRLRPENIVIGEIRGKEALAFNQAAYSGHGGVLTTLHSHGRKQTIDRLSNLGVSSNIFEKLSVITLDRKVVEIN